MADSGSTDTPDLALMVGTQELVDMRVALVRDDEGWQVRHGEITVTGDPPQTAEQRMWRYPEEAFVQTRVPGKVAGLLLAGQPQEVAGLAVHTPAPTGNGIYQRLPGHARWRGALLPWPRTEWEISPAQQPTTRQGGLLVGDGCPSFMSYEAAFSAFLYQAVPSNSMSSHHPLWRIIKWDRRAWLHQATITPNALTAAVKGTHALRAGLELSTPTGNLLRTVGQTGRVRLRLPDGLVPGSLLVLKRDGDWLDFRHFPTYGDDPSLRWDQPGTHLALLVAAGEGLTVEFKRQVPMADPASRKTVLKTVAAFASSTEGGTILFGVDDDGQTVGVDPATLDDQQVALVSMIRDNIDPEPRYELRTEQLDGRIMLLLEVTGSGRPHALHPAKPEFYVRRGASTVRARRDEIAIGFSTPTAATSPW
jgi:hypothetical protein